MPNPNPSVLHLTENFSTNPATPLEFKKEKKLPVTQDPDSGSRRILRTVLSNTVVLGCDFAASSPLYGMALKSEALVRKPKLTDFLKPAELRDAYALSWNVLKYGFWPTFILEVAATESVKQIGSPLLSQYSDAVMPAVIGAGTAPAVSFTAINTRYKLNLDPLQTLRQEGVRGVMKRSSGFGVIGIREALCYKALHHDTSDSAQKIATFFSNQFSFAAPLFRNKEGQPTLMSKALASSPDALALLASQPLTMFAVNASTLKHKLRETGAYARPKLTSPVALMNWHLNFARDVCQQIIEEGSKTGLSRYSSFAPGVVARTSSLFVTLAVFKYALGPVTNVVSDNITHRKNSNSQDAL